MILILLALGVWAAGRELYVQGYVRFNYPNPVRFPVRGIDVSHHQSAIDWPAVRSSAVDFAFIKATEGGDHRDREFAANWSGASAAGIARGAYHYFTFCTSGEAQARNFLGVLATSYGELPPAVDVEFAGNCRNWTSIDDIRTELRFFLAAVEARTGRRPLIYAPREAYARVIEGHFDDYGFWLRNVLREPRVAAWEYWQYADNGRVAGIPTLADLNVFRGSRDEFERSLSAAAGPRSGG